MERAWDVYHRSTIAKKPIRISEHPMANLVKIEFKEYGTKGISLSRHVNLERMTPLNSILSRRRSARVASTSQATLEELSNLVNGSFGITKQNKDPNKTRRAYPSAGARYPLEIYLFVQNCRHIANGIYHYNVRTNVIEVVRNGNFNRKIPKLIGDLGGYLWAKDTSFTVFITGIIGRSSIKYGERAYRHTLIEAGHAAQNALLVAESMRFKACPIGGFLDYDVSRFLGLGEEETPLYLIFFSKQ